MDSILQSVDNINDMNTHIATASEEQASVSVSINNNVQNISSIAQQTVVGAKETVATSGQIAEQAEYLKKMIGAFRV